MKATRKKQEEGKGIETDSGDDNEEKILAEIEAKSLEEEADAGEEKIEAELSNYLWDFNNKLKENIKYNETFLEKF